MRNPCTTLIFISILISFKVLSQTTNVDKLFNFNNIVGGYRYANVEPEGDVLQKLKNEKAKEYQYVSSLVVTAFENPDSLLTEKYLTIPDSSSLRLIYKLNALYYTSFQKNESQQKKMLDSLNVASISQPDLVHSYYNFLFSFLKKQSIDYSSVDIDLNKCVPGDSVGQIILFLTAVNICSMSIKSNPNLQSESLMEALENEYKRFPKFNKKPFYEMTAFPIIDFQVNFYQGIGISSFYRNRLTWYFMLLMGYYYVVKEESGETAAINKVWLKTALQNAELYSFLNENYERSMIKLSETVNSTFNAK